MARRPTRRGPRIRRPLTLAGGLLFAALSAAVVAIGFDGVALPPLPGLSPAPKPAPAPAEAQAPVAPDHPTPWPPAVDTANAPAAADTAPPPGPVAAPAAPAPASPPPAVRAGLRGQRSEPTAPAASGVVKISPPPPARPAPPPRPRAEEPGTADAGEGPTIQVGAFASEGLSEAEWSEISRIWPDKTVGKRHATETMERNGRMIYRSRVSGFASRAEAQAFCGALRASGRDCFLK